MITIHINGVEKSLPEKTRVSELLQAYALERKRFAVELNEHVLPKSELSSTILQAGDKIEIVHAIGGG